MPAHPRLNPRLPAPTDAGRQALDAFHAQFSAEATYLAYAPGRVTLIGDHTDYNEGFVLPMAIERGIHVAARKRTDRVARFWSAQMGGPVLELDLESPITVGLPAWTNYIRGVMAGLGEAGLELPGFDAAIVADLPAGGGLSSSAALELAVATLLEALAGVSLDLEAKALLCQNAEHLFAGMPCGIMDQFAVTFAEAGNLLQIDCRSRERNLVPLAAGEVSILIVNTMVRRELAGGGYADRRSDCDEVARILGVRSLRDATQERIETHRERLGQRLERRARHVVGENERTLEAAAAFRRGDWRAAGKLMYESHDSLRHDFDVSCRELDLVVEAARSLGAQGGVFGCRMTGGGFGGCCVALARTDMAAEVTETITGQYRAGTGIDPVIFHTRPAAGAALVFGP